MNGAGPHWTLEPPKQAQHGIGTPAPVHDVAVHAGCVVVSQVAVSKLPVKVPDPLYVEVAPHATGHSPSQSVLEEVQESVAPSPHAPSLISWYLPHCPPRTFAASEAGTTRPTFGTE
ncbi:MAG TPA: hypothetical protein VFG04_06290 [Planctomycetaceae bacterium]|nr:hypothetical protein [Planctomycetaceae bacterium]